MWLQANPTGRRETCWRSWTRGRWWCEGGGGNFLLLLASQNPYPIILVVYSVAKNRPNLSYFWENVIFTIPAVNTGIRGMVQIITTPAPQLCPLEAKNGITWQVIKCTKFFCFLFFLFSKLIILLYFFLSCNVKIVGKIPRIGFICVLQ